MVAMNAQTYASDIDEVASGGTFKDTAIVSKNLIEMISESLVSQ